MKYNYIKFTILIFLCFIVSACEEDNFEGPNASFHGIVVDKQTGEGIRAEQPQGFKIKWTELSWSEGNIVPEYFWGKMDGTFEWRHVFGYKGSSYAIQPVNGAFVTPEPQILQIKKGEKPFLKFEVIPYVRLNADFTLDGKVLTIKMKAIRPEGSFNTEKGPYAINKVMALVSNKTKYLSLLNEGGYDKKLSKSIPFKESDFDQEITSLITFPENVSGTHYVTVAFQTKNPDNRCNYSSVVQITIP